MCTPNLRPPLNGTNKHTRHIGIGMPVLLGAIEYSTKHSARWITPAPDSSQPQGARGLSALEGLHNGDRIGLVWSAFWLPEDLPRDRQALIQISIGPSYNSLSVVRSSRSNKVKAAVSSSDLKHLSRFSSSSDPPEQLQLLQLELRQLL
ncbi:unnamed protein product [Withania somnifera]